MKIYTVYTRNDGQNPDEDTEFVPESFSWAGFIFPLNFFWAIMNKCWLFLGLVVLVEAINGAVAMHYPEYKDVSAMVRAPIVVFFGLSANDFWRKSLEKRGYKLSSIVADDSEIRAKRRFFKR